MKKQLLTNNEEIMELFFKDVRSILYTKRPLNVQLKMLYAACSKAVYSIQINNEAIVQTTQ